MTSGSQTSVEAVVVAPARSFLADLRDVAVAAGFRPSDVTVEARRDLRAVPDARLFVMDRGSPAGVVALLGDLEAHPAIASIRASGRAGRVAVALRLTDEHVVALGRAVERHGAP
ncbi:MAG TPA: hypothetical protein VH479_17180, partial [Acidimicrobiales bacterium]